MKQRESNVFVALDTPCANDFRALTVNHDKGQGGAESWWGWVKRPFTAGLQKNCKVSIYLSCSKARKLALRYVMLLEDSFAFCHILHRRGQSSLDTHVMDHHPLHSTRGPLAALKQEREAFTPATGQESPIFALSKDLSIYLHQSLPPRLSSCLRRRDLEECCVTEFQ